MIYRFDNNPSACAQALTDRDLPIAISDVAGIFYDAHSVGWNNSEHCNWVRKTTCNYAWMYVYFCALLDEYKYRTDKLHAYEMYRGAWAKSPEGTPDGLETPFPKANYYDDNVDGAVKTYRNYYRSVQTDPPKWTRREPPEWMHLTKS